MSARVLALGLDLNEDLGEFHDDSYDVVILSQILQAVVCPDVVRAEMARIGTVLILLVLNVVYWRSRLKIIGEKIPIPHDLPYPWHDTLSQSYAGVADFEEWFASFNLKVVNRVCLDGRGRPSRVASAAPNLLAGSTIRVLKSHWVEHHDEEDEDRSPILEATDRHILALLEKDGRMSWTELGHQTGLSTSAAQQRVKRLEAKGIITGYHATLNLEAIGAGITAFIFLNPIDPEEDETIPGILRTFPEVRGCHSIAGAASYLARVQAPSAGHLDQLLTRIRKECLCGTETVVVLDTMFDDLGMLGTR